MTCVWVGANKECTCSETVSVTTFRYKFDGLDMDWEFPATRGSKPEDKFKFTKLMKVGRAGMVAVLTSQNATRG